MQYIFSYKDDDFHLFVVLNSGSGGFQSLILPGSDLVVTEKKEDYVVQCRVASSVIKLEKRHHAV